MSTNKKGSLVLVEVHGLPGDKVPSFTYEAHDNLEDGQLTLVPAPAWSIRVTGRAELPGFVLGPVAADFIVGKSTRILRTLPLCPAAPRPPETEQLSFTVTISRETVGTLRKILGS